MNDATLDDAPAATAKTGRGATDAASRLIDARGDQIVARSVTINRPASELYTYFRDFAKLPTFMYNVERIDVIASILAGQHRNMAEPGSGE